MSKRNIILIISLILLIIYVLYSARIGPLTPRFCDLYSAKTENDHADLIRKLNNYEICNDSNDDIFEHYIYWKDEMIAGVFDNILVFKGSDTLQDWAYNLTPHRGVRLINDIELIYDDIKNDIFDVIDKYNVTTLTGWSLGAILSCMTALDTSHKIDNIILFGLPNIFTNDFITKYNSKLGNKTTVYNNRFDIFVNAFGYGKNRNTIGETHWRQEELSNSYKLITKGLGHFHMSYFE